MLIARNTMAKVKVKGVVIKKGVLSQPSGTIDNLIFCRNGVVKIKDS